MHKVLDADCAPGVHSVSMHLSDYMTRNSLSDEDVAAAIGKHRVSVSRYRRGIERPSSDVIGQIFTWSGGKVAPNDWFEAVEGERTEAAE